MFGRRIGELAQPAAVLDRHAVGAHGELEPGIEHHLGRILVAHHGFVLVENNPLEREVRLVVATEIVVAGD